MPFFLSLSLKKEYYDDFISSRIAPIFEKRLFKPTLFFRTHQYNFKADWIRNRIQSSFYMPELVKTAVGMLSASLTGYPIDKVTCSRALHPIHDFHSFSSFVTKAGA